MGMSGDAIPVPEVEPDDPAEVNTSFDDLELHLKVISAYLVIFTCNISEIIYDTSTETEIGNKKSHDSFQVIRLSMTW